MSEPEGLSEENRAVWDRAVGPIPVYRDENGVRCHIVAEQAINRLLNASRASSEAKLKAVEAERDQLQSNWIIRMYHIREASGVGAKPMLNEVADAIRDRFAAVEARALAAEAQAAALAEALNWRTEALTYARERIAVAIAFLNRDHGDPRADRTVPQVVAQLTEADRRARIALQSARTEGEGAGPVLHCNPPLHTMSAEGQAAVRRIAEAAVKRLKSDGGRHG